MMAWIVLKETAETEKLYSDPPPHNWLDSLVSADMWCDKRRLCLCEAMGHENDNTEISISQFTAWDSVSAPQMVSVVAAELTKTWWKMILYSMWPVTECAARELCGFI